MLRSFPRAVPSSTSFRLSPIRASIRPPRAPLPICRVELRKQQARAATTHAISNPTLANIEKRWDLMPPQEQAELWMKLRDRMKVDWHDLTLQERKAAYWIAFGPHGPRAVSPPGENKKVFAGVMAAIALAFVIFAIIRSFARPPPRTMTRQYQEATNEYLRQQNVEPITGLSSEGYKGKGMIQSPPKRDD